MADELKNDKPAAKAMTHPRDPLHGITLEAILNQLVQRHGWSEMARRVPVRCFMFNPTVKSSLTFLRKTPWARKRVEEWFIFELPVPEVSAPVVVESSIQGDESGVVKEPLS